MAERAVKQQQQMQVTKYMQCIGRFYRDLFHVQAYLIS